MIYDIPYKTFMGAKPLHIRFDITDRFINPNMPGGEDTCGFLKNVFSKERVKSWFFVTFNIISKHIFPENFIEFPQVV